ncbi:hypothetical protein [Nonomuraea sp. KM90]|uniref:hypothetical protein n=1 Tax=Nonomuraea sp. KM90 TaxID=3457428 RepID=UPI003FCED8A5
MTDDEYRRETRVCADCEATPATPDVATIKWGRGDLVVTEHHTGDCPDYLKRCKPIMDDAKRTLEDDVGIVNLADPHEAGDSAGEQTT